MTLNKKRLEFVTNKKSYYQLFRIYRVWKRHTQIMKIAKIAAFNRAIKAAITAFYAIVQNCLDAKEQCKEADLFRGARMIFKGFKAIKVNA